jgi:hypothetical protein
VQDYQKAVHHFHTRRERSRSPPTQDKQVAPPRYTPAQSAAESRAVLEALASEQRRLLFCQRTQAKLDATAAEFSEYLERAAPPGFCTWETCTDVQVVVFLHAHYLPRHVGHSRSLVAPSTLNGTVSSLSRAFIARNRTGPWEVQPRGGIRGNPTDSQLVKDFKVTYARGAQLDGFYECSAVPLSETAFRVIMQALDQEICAEEQMQTKLCSRSPAAVDSHTICRRLCCALAILPQGPGHPAPELEPALPQHSAHSIGC